MKNFSVFSLVVFFLSKKPSESPGDGTKADLKSVPVSDAASGDRSAPTDVNQS